MVEKELEEEEPGLEVNEEVNEEEEEPGLEVEVPGLEVVERELEEEEEEEPGLEVVELMALGGSLGTVVSDGLMRRDRDD